MHVEIPITLYSDAKGYLDRECPNPNCQYTFKMQELRDLGITKSYLFPDLSSVGEEINARYPKMSEKETLS